MIQSNGHTKRGSTISFNWRSYEMYRRLANERKYEFIIIVWRQCGGANLKLIYIAEDESKTNDWKMCWNCANAFDCNNNNGIRLFVVVCRSGCWTGLCVQTAHDCCRPFADWMMFYAHHVVQWMESENIGEWRRACIRGTRYSRRM